MSIFGKFTKAHSGWDWTLDNLLISELIADARGHTPTKVAQLIFPKTTELNQNLYALVQQMNHSMRLYKQRSFIVCNH